MGETEELTMIVLEIGVGFQSVADELVMDVFDILCLYDEVEDVTFDDAVSSFQPQAQLLLLASAHVAVGSRSGVDLRLIVLFWFQELDVAELE